MNNSFFKKTVIILSLLIGGSGFLFANNMSESTFLFALKHDIDAIIMLKISILWNKIFFFIFNDICNFLLMDKFNKYLTCLT